METLASQESLRLDVGRPDHLAPLLGLLGDELAEVGGRACKYHAAEIGNARFDRGVGESRVHFTVEHSDDRSGRILRHAETEPSARLVARHEIAYGRDVR